MFNVFGCDRPKLLRRSGVDSLNDIHRSEPVARMCFEKVANLPLTLVPMLDVKLDSLDRVLKALIQ